MFLFSGPLFQANRHRSGRAWARVPFPHPCQSARGALRMYSSKARLSFTGTNAAIDGYLNEASCIRSRR